MSDLAPIGIDQQTRRMREVCAVLLLLVGGIGCSDGDGNRVPGVAASESAAVRQEDVTPIDSHADTIPAGAPPAIDASPGEGIAADPGVANSAPGAEVSGGPARPSDEQISRLFQTTWVVNYDRTIACPANADASHDHVSSVAWLYAIQWERRAFFKNEGIAWLPNRTAPKNAPRYTLERLDLSVENWTPKIRIVDASEWWYRSGDGTWLVFTEVE